MANKTKAAAGAKKPRVKKIKPFVIRERTRAEYRFNASEMGDIGRQLGDATNAKNALEEQKKGIVKEFSSKIAEKTALCNSLSHKVTTGYEMRDVECFTVLHRAERRKDFFKVNAEGKQGKLMRSEPMTETDFALLPMDQPEPPKAVPAKEGKKRGKATTLQVMPKASDGSLGAPISEAFKQEDARLSEE